MLRLLIVDDEPIILDGIRDMIVQEKSAFTKIVTAFDGIEALEVMEYFHPDLVITDIQMPEMDGLEFIAEARKRSVERFIILSGYDVFEYARKAIQLKVVEYLLKPIDQLVLSQLLKRMAIEIMEEKQNIQETKNGTDGVFSGNEYVAMLYEFIHKNFMKDISLLDAADYLNLHPVYLGQVFKKETGNTFLQYLTHVRIEKAKDLIKGSNTLTLETIAKCVGYENPRTFYKVFRKHVGQSPGQFRMDYQQGSYPADRS
jgi:Response regulator containing CheY-like receiver domain and AraC-type DNA-binding domain